jgi:hypothetical protein
VNKRPNHQLQCELSVASRCNCILNSLPFSTERSDGISIGTTRELSLEIFIPICAIYPHLRRGRLQSMSRADLNVSMMLPRRMGCARRRDVVVREIGDGLNEHYDARCQIFAERLAGKRSPL